MGSIGRCENCGQLDKTKNMEMITENRFCHNWKCCKVPNGAYICRKCKYEIKHWKNFEIIDGKFEHNICPRNDEEAKQITFGTKSVKSKKRAAAMRPKVVT